MPTPLIPRQHRAILGALLFALVVAACGQKGPLYLPADAPAKAPAAEEADAEKDEKKDDGAPR